MMIPSWVLMYLIALPSVTGHLLPPPDQSFLTEESIESSRSPPVWEWETQDKSEKKLLTLIRMVRQISDKKKIPDKTPDVKYPLKTEAVSKSPFKKLPDVNPKIVLPSKAPYVKPKIMAQAAEAETTPSSEPNHTTEQEDVTGAKIIQPAKPGTLAIKTMATQMEFTSTQEQVSTPSPTKGKDVSVFTKSTPTEATQFGKIQSTQKKHVSSQSESTSNTVLDDTTSVVPSKVPDIIPFKEPTTTPSTVSEAVTSKKTEATSSTEPNATPSKPIVTTAKPTTHAKTSGWIPKWEGSSTTPEPMTHISTTLEDKILTQSLLRQCMLAILVLAIVCTVFIITTIALAAKLSSMRKKQKLRHPASYTEMRCISTLLPESDQQSKLKPKRLKTFAAMEDSDGDNTTLNSFLPEH